jgi:hypothetical protein
MRTNCNTRPHCQQRPDYGRPKRFELLIPRLVVWRPSLAQTRARKPHLLPLIQRLVEARERGADCGVNRAHGGACASSPCGRPGVSAVSTEQALPSVSAEACSEVPVDPGHDGEVDVGGYAPFWAQGQHSGGGGAEGHAAQDVDARSVEQCHTQRVRTVPHGLNWHSSGLLDIINVLFDKDRWGFGTLRDPLREECQLKFCWHSSARLQVAAPSIDNKGEFHRWPALPTSPATMLVRPCVGSRRSSRPSDFWVRSHLQTPHAGLND